MAAAAPLPDVDEWIDDQIARHDAEENEQ